MERFGRSVSLGLVALTLAVGGVVLWVQLELKSYLVLPPLLSRLGFKVTEGELGHTGLWRYGGKDLTLASIDVPRPAKEPCTTTPPVAETPDDACPAEVCGDLEPIEAMPEDSCTGEECTELLVESSSSCNEDALPLSRFAVHAYEESLRLDLGSLRWIHRLRLEAPSLLSLRLEITSPLLTPSKPERVRVKSEIEDGTALAPGESLLKPYLPTVAVKVRILADVEQPLRPTKTKGKVQAWLNSTPRQGEDQLSAKGALDIDIADERASVANAWFASKLFDAKLEGSIGMLDDITEAPLDLILTVKPKVKDKAISWLPTAVTKLKIQGPLSDPEVLSEEELAFRNSPEFAYVSEYNHDCFKHDFLASDIFKEKLRETHAEARPVDCYANNGQANFLSFDLKKDGRSGLIASLVHPDSLLAKIGIREGDRIHRIDGKRLISDAPEALAETILWGKRRILVEATRKGQRLGLMVVRVSDLAASQAVAAAETPKKAQKHESLTVRRSEVDQLLGPGFAAAIGSSRFAVSERGGLTIESLSRGGLLHRLGFAEGDVILQVGSVALTGLDHALEIFQALEGGEATFVIERGKERIARVIRIEGQSAALPNEDVAH